nr:hypothetical protein [Rhizobiaceae bacterium]
LGGSLALKGATVTRKRIEHSILISGDVNSALAKIDPRIEAVGLGGEVGSGDHAIRIGRDTALLNSSKPINIAVGWYETGFAISQADGKYAVLEISGEGAEDMLSQGASIVFKHSSPSAMIQFAGLPCLLVRQNEAWLLFVERPMLTYMTTFLSGTSALQT